MLFELHRLAGLFPGHDATFQVVERFQSDRRRHFTGDRAALSYFAVKQHVVAVKVLSWIGQYLVHRDELGVGDLPILGNLLWLTDVDQRDPLLDQLFGLLDVNPLKWLAVSCHLVLFLPSRVDHSDRLHARKVY